ncbi:hypothetical protein M758_1G326300, partial [Ceratodon purpureus]
VNKTGIIVCTTNKTNKTNKQTNKQTAALVSLVTELLPPSLARSLNSSSSSSRNHLPALSLAYCLASWTSLRDGYVLATSHAPFARSLARSQPPSLSLSLSLSLSRVWVCERRV